MLFRCRGSIITVRILIWVRMGFFGADLPVILHLEVVRMFLLKADLSILADAGSVIAIGFTVVFLVLLLLTTIFKIFGLAMSNVEENDRPLFPLEDDEPDDPTPAAVFAPIVGNTETVSSKPEVDGGIPAETVAVISAAAACMAPEGTQYAVKGIRKL